MESVVSQEKIQEILNGPEFFTCERTHTRLRKVICAKRQRQVKGSGVKSYIEVPPECQGCEQREEIIKEFRDSGIQVLKKEEGKDMEKKICKIEDCDKPVEAKGLCAKHYQEWLYDPDRKLGHGEKTCSIEGCNRRVKADGLCKTHYNTTRYKSIKRPAIRESVITLDFEEYPEMFGELEDLAKGELRPVEMQALYLIKEGLRLINTEE